MLNFLALKLFFLQHFFLPRSELSNFRLEVCATARNSKDPDMARFKGRGQKSLSLDGLAFTKGQITAGS